MIFIFVFVFRVSASVIVLALPRGLSFVSFTVNNSRSFSFSVLVVGQTYSTEPGNIVVPPYCRPVYTLGRCGCPPLDPPSIHYHLTNRILSTPVFRSTISSRPAYHALLLYLALVIIAWSRLYAPGHPVCSLRAWESPVALNFSSTFFHSGFCLRTGIFRFHYRALRFHVRPGPALVFVFVLQGCHKLRWVACETIPSGYSWLT